MTEGRAYGIFYSPCMRGRIQEALDRMKLAPDIGMPREMRFSIYEAADIREGAAILRADERPLIAIAREWEGKGANFFIRCTLPGAGNRDTANWMGDIFNILYSCSPVLGDFQNPIADVYFRNEAGAYVSKRLTDAQ